MNVRPSPPRIGSRRTPALLGALVVACLSAAGLAFRSETASANVGPISSDAGTSLPSTDAATSDRTYPNLAPSAGDDISVTDDDLRSMPPGTSLSPHPSEAVFPPQSIALQFSHRTHTKQLGQPCRTCHPAAYTSDAATDRLLPLPTVACDGCHAVSHADLSKVVSGAAPRSQCRYCHVTVTSGTALGDPIVGTTDSFVVVRSKFPRGNLRFSHRRHTARNIGCGQCHGRAGEIDLATRDQLPRMAGCFVCHNQQGPAQGDAKGECETCHLTRPSGKLQTSLGAGGSLRPPRWLGGAAHDADWIQRHKAVAAEDSGFCANCHSESECTECHDGRVRPRSFHPNDWLSMHPQAARTDSPRCSSCHNEQVFCADCHRRTGIAQDTPSGNRPGGRRFHPPAAQWSSAPRGTGHHAWEAMRNLNACVSCHTERDCASCHASKGVMGGGGVTPHPLGFKDKCRLALRQNPRPCLVCHTPSDTMFTACR